MSYPRGDIVRPTVLTPETQRAIVEALVGGSYLSVACQAAGISVRIFDHWRKRYDDGDPVATEKYSDFFLAVKRASSVAEVNALNRLQAGPPNWQAQAWFLERRFSQRWGKKDRAPEPPKPPKPSKPLSEMTPAEIDAYESEVAEFERRTAKG